MQKSIKYSQYSESEPAKLVLIHEPSYEIFMSMLHPAGSLYKDVTSESLVAKDFENFRNKEEDIFDFYVWSGYVGLYWELVSAAG